MSLHSTFLAAWLLGLSLLIVPQAMSGQVPASDSTAVTSDSQPAKSDSQPAVTDSMRATGASRAYSDTVLQQAQPDSVSKTDSTRAASDTVNLPAAGKAITSDTATPLTAPVDSILGTACSGPAGPATVARDLLVVVFAPEAGAAERTVAAKSVDGTLLGAVMSEGPSAYYLRVPSGGEESRLRVAADQLILLDMVRQVGSRACPPLLTPDKARQRSP
jgi:hypothetical protein